MLSLKEKETYFNLNNVLLTSSISSHCTANTTLVETCLSQGQLTTDNPLNCVLGEVCTLPSILSATMYGAIYSLVERCCYQRPSLRVMQPRIKKL